MNIRKIKQDFPILKRKINGKKITYLDNAATTQKPIQVIKAETEFYTKHNANIHRGINTLSQEATEIYEKAHEKTANFIGTKDTEEIIFTKNTTEALNLLSYTLEKEIKKGDEILLTKMEHHANLVPWQQLSKRKKAKLVYANITKNLTIDLEDFQNKINKKTKIIAFTMASNILGTINPVKEMTKIAKEKEEKITIIDAAQAIPHKKINVKEIGCDFLAFSAHKMLGPMGLGILYGKKEILEKMPPFLTGGDMITKVTLKNSTWNKLPWKFEAGTPNVAGAAGLSAAIDYIQKIKIENIEEHCQKLLEYALKKISNIEKVKTYTPKGPKTSIMAFNLKGIHSHDLATILDNKGIIIRSGNHCAQPLLKELKTESIARASFYIYNTKQEIDLLIEGIEETKKIFGD
ncbi:MAG: cysteine desulfurase [Candidatus Diapherotrites archaeon]